MSRSLRHKSPPTPRTPLQKKSRRTSRATDNSSDDDYDGVDLISDDEESEPDVEGVEEQAIIDSEADDEDEDDDDDLQSTPRPLFDDEEVSWEGFGPDTAVIPGGTFFDEHISRMDGPDHDTEATLWNTTGSSVFTDADTPGRRVHFDLSDSDSDDEGPNDDPFYPDIFVDQNSLAPSFRREIQKDIDADHHRGGGFWDSSDNEVTPRKAEQNDSESDSSTSSSGYESDEGETTEEDLPPAASFIQAPGRSVLRRLSDASESEEEITVTRRTSMRNRGPFLASWVHDRSKPFAVLDSHGKKLIMFKATVKRRVSFSGTSNRRMLETVPEMDTELFSPGDQMSPMISNSGNIMLGAMSSSIDQYAGLGPALGPPEAFHPFTSIDANGTITQDGSSSWDEDDYDEDEHVWRLDDFFEFPGDLSCSDEEGDDQDPVPSSDTVEATATTPKRPTTSTSEDQAHPLLDHFEVRNVGSFRKNQNLHTQLTRHAVSSDALAFSGPYGHGTLKGIKGGRLAAANSPITPMPRDRNLEMFVNSPSSPLSKASANSKRKFDGDHFSHKRSRSAV